MSGIKRVLLAGGLVLILSALPTLAQDVKLGVFDAQAVSENSEMGKRIQAVLTAFTEGKEGEITQLQQRVAQLRKQLSEQSLSLSPDRRAELEKNIQRHVLELQSFQEAASRELELEYATATKEFQDKLVLAIDTFGKDEGFAVILDRSQVAWFNSAIDVTSAVIDRFNRMFPDTAAEGQGE